MHTIPVIVSTFEGLIHALEDSPPLLYIDNCLWTCQETQIRHLLASRLYHGLKKGKQGMFFIRDDIGAVSIWDPLDIL